MAQGLDELVEWLVGEVSFYGDGCPLSELLASIRKFQENDEGIDDGNGSKDISREYGGHQSGQSTTNTKTPPTEDELKLARLAWKWLMDTGEVNVGPDGEWNHLTFDDILSIPEEPGGQGSMRIEHSKLKDSSANATQKPKKLPKIQPRLFVGEDTVWKTLTGHGTDYKRVPNLEWKCLIVIGSSKENGIIQGDLVRETGQDKRSVPKRTDFLAQKGYIAKRTHMVRGTKTSKLWLARFAPTLPVPSNPLGSKNLSRGSLTKDIEPVAWHDQWTGKDTKGRDQISYVALGQTIIAVIKAWGTLRIRDLKSKLGILGKKWHMKVMSRFLRRFNKLGNLTYVAATFVGEKHVFKDCIRFNRDPTEEDWRKLMATGKKTSTRNGQPGGRSRSKKPKGRPPKKAVNRAKPIVRILKKKDRVRPRPVVTGWVPEKPLANTLADYVLTGGNRGYSNTEVSTDTVGFAFRRLLLKYMSDMSNEEVQPPDLQEYQMRYDKVKFGGKYQFMYTIVGTQKEEPAAQPQEAAIDPALREINDGLEQQLVAQSPIDFLGFRSVDTNAFIGHGSSNLTILSRVESGDQTEPQRARQGRQPKARMAKVDAERAESAKQPEGERDDEPAQVSPQPSIGRPRSPAKSDIIQDGDVASDALVTRPSRKRKASQRVSYLASLEADAENTEAVVDTDADGGAPPRRKRTATVKGQFSELLGSENRADEDSEEEQNQDRSKPGVYIGTPGSLAPNPHKKGRPRKSLVVIFRSDKIKDPNHLPGWSVYPKPPAAVEASRAAINPRKRQRRPLEAIEVAQTNPDQTLIHQQAAASIQVVVGLDSSVSKAVEQQQQSVNEHAEVAEATIVVHGSISIDEDQERQEDTPVEAALDEIPEVPAERVMPVSKEPLLGDVTAREDIEQPKKRVRGPKKPKLDKYVCEKCGGTWKNDIGLKYHLEKAKVACNPYYAEHPELMVKAKAVRTSRVLYGTPEPDEAGNARGGGSQRSDSASPRLQTPKLTRVPRKKTNLTPRPVDPCDSTNHRTILKQRSILKHRHPGALGLFAPRGVKVLEAVAKETATPDQAESAVFEKDTAATANPTPVEMVAAGNRSPESLEQVDLEEDLPYLAHIRPAKPKLQSGPSAFQPQGLREAGYEHQRGSDPGQASLQSQPLNGAVRLDMTEADRVYPELPASMNESSATFDPYPVEMLDPTIRSSRADGVIVASSTTLTTPEHFDYTTRRPLPVQRPFTPRSQDMAAESTNVPDQAPQKRIPPFRLPPTDFTRWTENTMRRYRVIEIIRYLVINNKGVFPGGRALFYAVLKIYAQAFPKSELPTAAGMTRALRALQDEKTVKETSAAYRSDGHWSTLDMVMLTHISPNGEVAGDLKRQMKDAQPGLYIPPAFAPTASEEAEFVRLNKLPKARNKGPGRRDHKLAEDIGVLSAPLYVEKGMAGMRRKLARIQSDDEESNAEDGDNGDAEAPNTPQRRKRKRVADDPSTGGPAAKKTRRGRKSRKFLPYGEYEDIPPGSFLHAHKYKIHGSHAENPGLGSLPPSFFSGPTNSPVNSYTAPTRLQFLAPNTRLGEEDGPEPEAEDIDATPSNDLTPEFEEHFLRTAGEGPFASTVQLCATDKGIWPNMSNTWFEANGGSFSMKGWFPNPKELLKQHLPKNMEQMAYKITSHCKTDKWADPAYGQFLTSVDGCMSWELSDQGQRHMSGSIVPDYLFICFSSGREVSNMAPCEPQWHDINNWTLQTIPYGMLVDEEEEAAQSAETAELYGIVPMSDRGLKRGPGRPRKYDRPVREGPPRKYVRRGQKDDSIRELKLQRELTAYPREAHEYFRQKGQEDHDVDWKAEDTRIAAYVAVSTLLGGINKAMDWGVMMRIFPDAKLSNLRKFWATIRKEREGFIQNLTVKFQEDFLDAYERGDVPPIDFDKPLEYDWPRLVKWTLALVVREGIDLPATHAQLNEDLELIPVEKGGFDWRDSFYHWQRSVFNKFQDATSEAAATILSKKDDVEDDDTITARSWVRALCCTEAGDYTPHSIKTKFLTLARDGRRTEQEVSDLLENTIRDLEHRRIAIKQRSQALTTGRPYKLNEHFLRTLDRFSNEIKFTVAADYKLKMDEAFRKGEALEIPWRTEDGMVLAALNMQAHGRVRIEPVKRLDIPFGFKPGFYESRKFPKSYYRFGLQITPTSKYLYNEEIEVLQKATEGSAIPTAPEDGKLPMWCDFFGKPDRARWFKILSSVLFVLGTRGAMTDEFTAQALRPCVEIFEVEMIRKWALQQGVVNEITEGGGAFSVCEWWWLVCGLPIIEMKEAAEGEKAGRLTNDQYAGWHKRRWRGKYRVH
ncbi:hypothetical protein VM1G_10631 [Cytospora mali]|uniref:Uncharacterized protein n=1 Tax=Cytospora mali TaxID=578113 RepID=A0A194VIF0_CYTMA|nr:hypothetical protein VM1G_10631 [Valsa mali]